MFHLGSMYQTGNGVSKDYYEAAKWIRKAADLDNEEAIFRLGTMYETGDGIIMDEAEALKWFRKAADLDDKYAMFRLGSMLQNGEGVSKNDSEALKWYFKAADHRNVEAWAYLGFIYQYGKCGVSTDCVEAVRWYRKAGSHGNVDAMFALGNCYKLGRGVSTNYAEAVKWFSKAADLGYAAAMGFLGTMYQNGYGVAKDDSEALGWYRNAAERGDIMGMYLLGSCYAYGRGVKQDDVSSYMWFSLAALKDPESVAFYKTDWLRVGQRMTESQILEAKRLATAHCTQQQSGTDITTEENASNLKEAIATGTGFFVTTNGYLLTAWHVVSKANKVKVCVNGKTLEARVVRSDTANDVALLKVDGAFSALAVMPSRSVKLGADVFTVGFPNIGLQGAAPKLTKGNVGALSGIQDDPRAFQISVPVQPGNSGGPLLDSAGNVVGVVVSQLDAVKTAEITGSLPQGVNYAVKSAYVQPLLDAIPETSVLPPAAKVRPFDDAVKAAESAVCIVLAYGAAE